MQSSCGSAYQGNRNASLVASGFFESVVGHLERGQLVEGAIAGGGGGGSGNLATPFLLNLVGAFNRVLVLGQKFGAEHELLSALIRIQLLHELRNLVLHVDVLIDLWKGDLQRSRIIAFTARGRPAQRRLNP